MRVELDVQMTERGGPKKQKLKGQKERNWTVLRDKILVQTTAQFDPKPTSGWHPPIDGPFIFARPSTLNLTHCGNHFMAVQPACSTSRKSILVFLWICWLFNIPVNNVIRQGSILFSAKWKRMQWCNVLISILKIKILMKAI